MINKHFPAAPVTERYVLKRQTQHSRWLLKEVLSRMGPSFLRTEKDIVPLDSNYADSSFNENLGEKQFCNTCQDVRYK